jgi:drug/metabolite transporter (DMT)-like permease
MSFSPSSDSGSERSIGTVFAFLSTSFYAISNTSMRFLTDYPIDNDWILFFKELTGFLILFPWLLFRFSQGRFRFVSKRLILSIVLAAVLCELFGAHLQLLGYAVVGLVISVPLIQSSTLLGVAIFGWYWFGDPLSQRRKFAIAVLIAAGILLSVGKELTVEESAGMSTAHHNLHCNFEQNTGVFLLAAAGTVAAGIVYSVYIIMLRQAIRRYWHDDNSAWLSFQFTQWIGFNFPAKSEKRQYAPFPVTLMMSIVLGIGMIIFGLGLFLKHGAAGFYEAPTPAWYVIPISGVCNMIGFFFQIQGLRMTTAVQASLIAVSQIILMSLIGRLCFSEPINWLITCGLILTAYGIAMSVRSEQPNPNNSNIKS